VLDVVWREVGRGVVRATVAGLSVEFTKDVLLSDVTADSNKSFVNSTDGLVSLFFLFFGLLIFLNFLWGSIFLLLGSILLFVVKNSASFLEAITASKWGLISRILSMMAKSPSLSVTLSIKFNVSFASRLASSRFAQMSVSV
jgi:hypothetical protein